MTVHDGAKDIFCLVRQHTRIDRRLIEFRLETVRDQPLPILVVFIEVLLGAIVHNGAVVPPRTFGARWGR